MIPVLVIPVLNRWDLGRKLLASIDHPVDRIVIVDNGKIGMRHPGALHIRPISNLGCGGGINAGIVQTPDAPW